MEQDAIIVKELKQELDKNKKPYTVVIDGTNNRWNLFGITQKLELNKGYLFRYERNGEYKNVKTIEALSNTFKVEALKEMASRNDIKRDLFMSLSYAKDLRIAHEITPEELFTKAEEIYKWVNTTADGLMPKEEK